MIKKDLLGVKPNIFFDVSSTLNQSTDYKYRMDCPIFSSLNNLCYNTGITVWENGKTVYQVEEDIDELCKKAGLHSDDKGGYAKCMEVAYDYIKKFDFVEPEENKARDGIDLIICTFDDAVYKGLLKLGYMVRTLVGVNSLFFNEGRDKGGLSQVGNQYKGKISHFLNIGNDLIFDNYQGKGKNNTYKYPFRESKKFVTGKTCYAFVRKY